MNNIIILDRDGVINQESRAYIKNPDELIFIPNSIEAIARLSQAGFMIIITTNQSGVARGFFTEAMLHNIHAKLEDAVNKANGALSLINYCPHLPTDNCTCRKPKIGMIENSEKKLGISIRDQGYYLVGDSPCDMELAINAGCRPCLVETGDGLESFHLLTPEVRNQVFVYPSLWDVANELLRSADVGS